MALGCVDVNGGAVELGWIIRRSDGEGLSCSQAGIAAVRLEAVSQSSDRSIYQSWACAAKRGTTLFDIPEGRYALSITPTCAGKEPAFAQVPPPVVRDIVMGEVAQLNVLLISVPGSGAACGGSPVVQGAQGSFGTIMFNMKQDSIQGGQQ